MIFCYICLTNDQKLTISSSIHPALSLWSLTDGYNKKYYRNTVALFIIQAQQDLCNNICAASNVILLSITYKLIC